MPIIIFESGILTKDVKQELIEQLTNTAAAVTKIPKESFIVSIHEIPDENIAIGGKTVKELKEN